LDQKSVCLRVRCFVGALCSRHRKGYATLPYLKPPLLTRSSARLMHLRQVAECIPLTLQQFSMSNAFAASSVLSWAPGIPDLILAVLFACQNDISAAIDVGLAAVLTVTM
jgi:hypothetical protein